MVKPGLPSRTIWFQLPKCPFPRHLGRTLKSFTWAKAAENRNIEVSACFLTYVLITALAQQLSGFQILLESLRFTAYCLWPSASHCLTEGWLPPVFSVLYSRAPSPNVVLHIFEEFLWLSKISNLECPGSMCTTVIYLSPFSNESWLI